jgi:DNA-binding transcriptional LysR family regulator
MPLNLHLLRLFATVARAGSFSKAAEILLLSQPSISKGVRDFELQLGCRLLDRNPRGVKPTREGLALMRHAETLFAAERDAEEELRALRSLDSGSAPARRSRPISSRNTSAASTRPIPASTSSLPAPTPATSRT